MAVSWNTFRARHKGKSKEEISDLWKKYKDGAYDLPPIEGESLKAISKKKIDGAFGSDGWHGRDLDALPIEAWDELGWLLEQVEDDELDEEEDEEEELDEDDDESDDDEKE